MKLGVVCSSGGGSLRAAFPLLASRGFKIHVVTDRPCPVEAWCAESSIDCRRIVDPDNAGFSRAALESLSAGGAPDAVVLFYLRIVTAPLVGAVPCFNLHPSLLPAFPGFGALASMRRSGARFFGATLHLATEDVDAGPILAQVCEPVPASADDPLLARRSFLHKTYLLLLLAESMESGALQAGAMPRLRPGLPASANANPCLSSPPYREAMRAIAAEAGCAVFQ